MEEDQRSSVAVKKLKALHDGKLATDVIFVIGADDEITEEIAAIKSDLVLSSEYFGRLFSSTWTPPNETKIRLRNIDGSTFLLIVEFCTLSGQLVSDVGSLEECLRLARAADEFLIRDLSCLCAQMLEDSFLSVDNVWKVMNKHYQINAITSPCLKFLSSKSEQCLQHPSFMDARCEAVQLFLSLKKMNISSELELLDACLRFLEPHSLYLGKNSGSISCLSCVC
ncbi:uncharacterized protein LOC135936301 [Cloeon dipterum]|uniref:uncharacterized protein LOC135936301 n=1 Tax=Cloeon dipterum TaxID=197152 RepID=UPI00321FBBF6